MVSAYRVRLDIPRCGMCLLPGLDLTIRQRSIKLLLPPSDMTFATFDLRRCLSNLTSYNSRIGAFSKLNFSAYNPKICNLGVGKSLTGIKVGVGFLSAESSFQQHPTRINSSCHSSEVYAAMFNTDTQPLLFTAVERQR